MLRRCPSSSGLNQKSTSESGVFERSARLFSIWSCCRNCLRGRTPRSAFGHLEAGMFTFRPIAGRALWRASSATSEAPWTNSVMLQSPWFGRRTVDDGRLSAVRTGMERNAEKAARDSVRALPSDPTPPPIVLPQSQCATRSRIAIEPRGHFIATLVPSTEPIDPTELSLRGEDFSVKLIDNLTPTDAPGFRRQSHRGSRFESRCCRVLPERDRQSRRRG